MEIGKSKRFGLQTYQPKERIEIDKEATLSLAGYIAKELMWLGGFIVVFISGIFIGIKGFFSAKKKIRQIQSRYEKTADFTHAGKMRERFRMRIE